MRTFLIAITLWAMPSHGRSLDLNIKELGAIGDGRADDSAAFAAAFASSNSPKIIVPPGIYRIPCGNYFKAASAISLVGSGQVQTTIKYDTRCTIVRDLIAWDGQSGITLQDLTIDFNNPAVPDALTPGIVFYAYAGNASNIRVKNMSIVNGSDRMFILAFGASNGFSIRAPIIEKNLITLGKAGILQNQCIAFTTNNYSGDIVDAKVTSNRCVGSGIQYDGGYGVVAGNDVSGFKFGTGIFGAFNEPPKIPQSCRHTRFSDNKIHSTSAGVDSNNTAFGGIENNCIGSMISGNSFYDLGGAAITNYGRNTTIANNRMWNNSHNGANGAGGYCDQGAVCVAVSPLGAPYDSDNIVVSGNKIMGGPRTQIYGYVEAPGFKGRAAVERNDFSAIQQDLRISSPQTKVEGR